MISQLVGAGRASRTDTEQAEPTELKGAAAPESGAESVVAVGHGMLRTSAVIRGCQPTRVGGFQRAICATPTAQR